MMKEKVYIVGGSGFIGKHISVFLSQYYEVFVFDKRIDKQYFSQYPEIGSMEIDVVKSQLPLSFETPSYLLNLASTIVTATRELEHLEQNIADNVKILMNLYDRFHHKAALKLLIQFGSSEEYGNGVSPFIETQREMPNSTYGILKLTTSNLALMLHANEGFPAMVVRPGNLFGKYQSEQRFIPYVLKQLRQNQPVEVTGCEQKRDFMSIDDFVSILQKIMLKHEAFVGEIINISSGMSISLKQIIEQMKNLIDTDSQILYGKIPYRENEMMDLKCNINKLENLLGESLKVDTMQRISDYTKEVQ